ncbi:MAG: hypothetical protein ACTTJH_01120 [Bacteroidales bacterium]
MKHKNINIKRKDMRKKDLKSLILFICTAFFSLNIFAQIDIKGDYVLENQEQLGYDAITSLINQCPLMALVLTDSSSAKDVLNLVPKTLTISNNKVKVTTFKNDSFLESKFEIISQKPNEVEIFVYDKDKKKIKINIFSTKEGVMAECNKLFFKKIK